MIRYVFRENEPLRIKNAKLADAQVIGDALAALAEASGNGLEPAAVVEAARDPGNVLHPHFEWDDALAAEKFRQDQARDLIRCIRTADIEADGEPVRAFLSISDNGRCYRTIQEIQGSSDLRNKLLEAAERDLEAFQQRFKSLHDICAIVETARKAARAKRTKNETQAA